VGTGRGRGGGGDDDDSNLTKAFAAVPPGCSDICDASWGPIHRRVSNTMDYMLGKFNTSFDYVIDELDDILDSTTGALNTKMQNHVVELAEQQRRIARMHRQLTAAMDNGAVPDPEHVSRLTLAATSSSYSSSASASSEGLPQRVKAKVVNVIHEIEHSQSWLMLIGQVAIAAVLGTSYEKYRSGKRLW
jgi:hypothetical protein